MRAFKRRGPDILNNSEDIPYNLTIFLILCKPVKLLSMHGFIKFDALTLTKFALTLE